MSTRQPSPRAVSQSASAQQSLATLGRSPLRPTTAPLHRRCRAVAPSRLAQLRQRLSAVPAQGSAAGASPRSRCPSTGVAESAVPRAGAAGGAPVKASVVRANTRSRRGSGAPQRARVRWPSAGTRRGHSTSSQGSRSKSAAHAPHNASFASMPARGVFARCTLSPVLWTDTLHECARQSKRIGRVLWAAQNSCPCPKLCVVRGWAAPILLAGRRRAADTLCT